MDMDPLHSGFAVPSLFSSAGHTLRLTSRQSARVGSGRVGSGLTSVCTIWGDGARSVGSGRVGWGCNVYVHL